MRNWWRKWKAQSPIFGEGITGEFLMSFGTGPLLVSLVNKIGGGPLAFGLINGLMGLAAIIQVVMPSIMNKSSITLRVPFIGQLEIRVPKRKPLMSSMLIVHRVLLYIAAPVALISPSGIRVWVFITLLSISFFAASAAHIPWSSLELDVTPQEIRGKINGIRSAVIRTLSSGFILLVGFLLTKESGFIWIYAIMGAVLVLNAFSLKTFPNPPYARKAPSFLRDILNPLKKNKPFRKATLVLAAITFVQNIGIPMFTLIMLDLLSVSSVWVSAMITIQMAASVTGYMVWGHLKDKFTSRALLRYPTMVIGIACLLWFGIERMFSTIAILILIHIILGFGKSGNQLLLQEFAFDEAPETERLAYKAVLSPFIGIVGFIGTSIGGVLYSVINDTFWLIYGIPGGIGIALIALVLFSPFGKRKSQ